MCLSKDSGGHMSTASTPPRTGQIVIPTDPSRRPDVLLRRRMPDDHKVSAWWMIGAFVFVSVAVVGLLNFVPG